MDPEPEGRFDTDGFGMPEKKIAHNCLYPDQVYQ